MSKAVSTLNPIDNLSRREQQVLGWAARGLLNKQIAQTLCIAEGTVEQHFNHIYEKLGLKGINGSPRTEAINMARERGLHNKILI